MSISLKLSITHAIIQTIFVLPDLWANPPWKIDPIIMLNATSLKIQIAHYIFLLYILTDTLQNYSNFKYDMWFHHILTFVGISLSLYSGPQYLGYYYLSNEFSTIFLHLRHYIRHKFACKLCFLLTFTVFRVGLNLYLLYWTMKYVGFGLPFMVQIIPYFINLWWYRRILSIAFNYK